MKPRVRNVAVAFMFAAVVLIVAGVLVENGFWLAMVGAFLATMATFAVAIDASKRQ